MSVNRGQIKANVLDNLHDAGSVFDVDSEVNDSLQDAYNEIVAKTRCQVKSIDIAWANGRIYYDFLGQQGISDYLGVIAIYNYNSNLYLGDCITMRDLDRIRRDWELWEGQPIFWVPHSFKYTVIVPHMTAAIGNMRLTYWANAPTFAADTDVPITATDMSVLFEYYSTADLLETLEQPSKAIAFSSMFQDKMLRYKERCAALAKSDLLLRV